MTNNDRVFHYACLVATELLSDDERTDRTVRAVDGYGVKYSVKRNTFQDTPAPHRTTPNYFEDYYYMAQGEYAGKPFYYSGYFEWNYDHKTFAKSAE